MEKRRFSSEELSRFNGRAGAPSFIACYGKVYDVSSSFLWQNGVHQVLHAAGEDLTAGLYEAPHEEDLLDSFPLVGTLTED